MDFGYGNLMEWSGYFWLGIACVTSIDTRRLRCNWRTKLHLAYFWTDFSGMVTGIFGKPLLAPTCRRFGEG